MAVPLEFAIHQQTFQFLRSTARVEPFDFPLLIAGDVRQLRVRFVKDAPSGFPGALVQVPLSGLSVQVQFGIPGQTPFTSVTLSYVADSVNGDYLSGNLPLNVTAVEDEFDAPNGTAEFTWSFDVQVTEGGSQQTYRRWVRIANEQDTAAYVDPEPPDTALGQAQAANQYVPKSGSNGFILIDQGTAEPHFVYVLNGVLRADPVT